MHQIHMKQMLETMSPVKYIFTFLGVTVIMYDSFDPAEFIIGIAFSNITLKLIIAN